VVKNIKIAMELNNNIELNSFIEQTLLKADTTKAEIENLCLEAKKHNFHGICIPPYFIKTAKLLLADSTVKIITVVGFPLGYNTLSAKVEETKRAIEDGADEIDMVMNISAFKNNDLINVKDGIESVATYCRLKAKIIKVIIETNLLSDTEIVKACEICATIGVDYVKSCTGFFGGVKKEHIELMRSVLPDKIKIKASGGIRDAEFAHQLVEAGADRIGTSSGTALVK